MMYLPFLLLCVFIRSILGNTELEEFGKFIKKFNKVYKNPKEYQYRLTVFTSNLNVTRHLQEKEQGTAKYGITEFSDLTDEEFTRNSRMLHGAFPSNKLKELKVEASPVQRSCDWRKAGVISKVKNQGACGSCWAFATVGNIEAQWGILGHPVNLSVQQILDCGPYEAGCKGGYFWEGYETVIQQGGLVSEDDYPYKGVKLTCRSDQFYVVKSIDYFAMLPKDEAAMATTVMNYGTINVGVNSILLKHYLNGVIHNPLCDPSKTNHAVLLVGYSEDYYGRYWIVKNSWGKSWGENGYFRITYGNNECGIATSPVTAVVTDPGSRRIYCPA
ncbi:cathepsin W [Hyla sarda]|uniref:cathepsin W n=1 Tax=Hyla sarda TaxID=327740 RepID=UPI0024C27F46|nr:cathepsin W [Hyla sarda]